MTVGSIGPASASPPTDPREQLMQSAKDFESVFLTYVFRSMRETVPDNTDAGVGEGMFTAMFDDALARLAANQQTHGLAEGLYRQLARHLPDVTTATVGDR